MTNQVKQSDPTAPERTLGSMLDPSDPGTRLFLAAPDLLGAFEVVPQPPRDFDTEEGCRVYAEAIMAWLDTTCAAAIAKARGAP